MTNDIPPEWRDLAEQWQSNGAVVSSEEIQRRLRRDHLQMWVVAGAEALGAVVGLTIALWLAIYTSFAYLGWGLVFCVAVSTAVAMRLHFTDALSGAADVLSTLEAAIAREDRGAQQLQLGRSVEFVALFAVIMVLSTQLRDTRSVSSAMLITLLASALYVVATLMWNAVLTHRLRQRRARLQILSERLSADHSSQP